ncbi:ribosomal maturation YjgA family protein [Aminipila sp.]|uniref:ribosomal maturation YjgA family protein n=1 Tax=Aminipila sp. TaxID=2060095 RepID=UPI002F3FCA4C
MKNDFNAKRVHYLVAFIMLLIIEILIALYIHDNFIRPYAGDILVVVLVYCFIRIFIPNGVRMMPLYVFIFSASVESLQYFRVLEMIGFTNNTFLRIVLGSVFDFKDIFCYGIGCLIIGIYESLRLQIHQQKNNRKL